MKKNPLIWFGIIILGCITIAIASKLPLYQSDNSYYSRSLLNDKALTLIFSIGCVFSIIYGLLNTWSPDFFIKLKIKAIGLLGLGGFVIIKDVYFSSYKLPMVGFYLTLCGLFLIISSLVIQIIIIWPKKEN
jgi:hypothetical protein